MENDAEAEEGGEEAEAKNGVVLSHISVGLFPSYSTPLTRSASLHSLD